MEELVGKDVFFFHAARSDRSYLENEAVNLSMSCLLVCFILFEVSLLKSRFLQILGCQKPSPYLGRLQ